MYSLGTTGVIKSNNFLVAGIKLYELVKKAFKPAVSVNNNSKEYLPYILNSLAKGYTVLDVGHHKKEFIFDLFKIAKLPGRLIVFELEQSNYSYLLKRKQLMKFENVIIENTFILDNDNDAHQHDNENEEAAPAINFDSAIKKRRINADDNNTIDRYCVTNRIIPELIKIKQQKDLGLLFGAREILQKYKPKVLVECCESLASRETMLSLFKFLIDLNYTGYFILDTIKVPLANFDFNTYQNEVLGFYCNNFIFE